MAKAFKELQFAVKNKIGVLAQVTKVFKEAGINILCIAAWAKSGKGFFNVVTDKNVAAKKALKKIGIAATEKPVLVLNLQNRVGALDRVARKLAKAKVDITGLSATAGGKRVSVMLNTKNNSKALKLI